MDIILSGRGAFLSIDAASRRRRSTVTQNTYISPQRLVEESVVSSIYYDAVSFRGLLLVAYPHIYSTTEWSYVDVFLWIHTPDGQTREREREMRLHMVEIKECALIYHTAMSTSCRVIFVGIEKHRYEM